MAGRKWGGKAEIDRLSGGDQASRPATAPRCVVMRVVISLTIALD
jgi:hypothetical protein